jgi:hypothetical protein
MSDSEKAFREITADLAVAYSDMLRKSYNIPEDYTYFDSPYMLDEFYQDLISVIGEARYIIASGSKGGGFTRVTMFISPEGIENIRKNNS